MLELAAAFALAFVGAVLLFTVSRDTAIRFCAGLSLILILGVPLTRLAPSDGWLRIAVPAVLIALTLVMVARARTFAWGTTGILVALYLLFGLLVAASAAVENAMLLYALTATTAITAFAQGRILASTGNLDWLFRLFIGLAIVIAIYAVVEISLAVEPLWRGARILADGQSVVGQNPLLPGYTRAQATFGHPLPLGLVLAIGVYLRLKIPARRPLDVVLATAMMLAGIVASGSRNALVIVALVTVLVWANRLRAMRVPVVLASGIGGLVLLLRFFESDVTTTGSYTHRIAALETIGRLLALQDVTAVLFGSGEAALPTLYTKGLLQTDGLAAVDNQFVFQVATTGLIGTALVGAIGYIALRSAGTPVRGVLLILLIACLIFDLLAWPSSAFIAWLTVGAAIATPTAAPMGYRSPSGLRLETP